MNLDQFKRLGDLDKHDYIKSNFPANAKSMSKRKLIFGVGVNDSAYVTNPTVNGKMISDPCYVSWSNILRRCYCSSLHIKCPTYSDCTICGEWINFSSFNFWWKENQVDGWQIDKDIILPGNKIYSKDMCVFVPSMVNLFVLDKRASRGEWPIGVCWSERYKSFAAQCSNPFNGKNDYLGGYPDPQRAHNAWRLRKLELVPIICSRFPEMDQRVELALIKRYSQQGVLS